ncbi:hypothetical protein MIR68_010918 [Amoeboaphelidium protococcarum]|nr:hypothetical protein MIR68_010918 [Amoeboaphelidium protococcarum]
MRVITWPLLLIALSLCSLSTFAQSDDSDQEDTLRGSKQQQQHQGQYEDPSEKQRRELDYRIWDLMDDMVAYFGEGKNWYEVLNVPDNAPAAEITKSYKKLSLQYHPDKNDAPDADKKFKVLGGVSKILRDNQSRARYNHWLHTGIPFWRGSKFYFRKSENLSVTASFLLVLIGAACVQYAAQFVNYLQIKAGLRLLALKREQMQLQQKSKKSPNGSPRGSSDSINKLAGKQQVGGGASGTGMSKRQMKKARSSDSINNLNSIGGGGANNRPSLFDDSNMKKAVDYLVLQHQIIPEHIFDKREWDITIEQEFNGIQSALDARMPNPFKTLFVFYPLRKLLNMN